MDNFKIIYKILKFLEKQMDMEETNLDYFNHTSFDVSKPRFARIISILVKDGYITGIEVWNALDCDYPRIEVNRPEITLMGLEYLNENSLMKKAQDLAKGIVNIVK